jgi:hypothetical protein
VVTTSDNTSLRDASSSLRRGGGDGLVVAVLGSLDPEETRLLGRLRHGTTAAVAVVLDTATWASPAARRRAAAGADVGGPVRLLRASGWRVLPVRAGDALPDIWPDASRHHVERGDAVGAVPSATGAAR